MRKPALYTAAVIFTAVALAHWLRFFFATEFIVAGVVVPVFWSLPAAIVLTALAAWMIAAARRS